MSDNYIKIIKMLLWNYRSFYRGSIYLRKWPFKSCKGNNLLYSIKSKGTCIYKQLLSVGYLATNKSVKYYIIPSINAYVDLYYVTEKHLGWGWYTVYKPFGGKRVIYIWFIFLRPWK